MKQMPAKLLTEWIAFFKLEEQFKEESKLSEDALAGAKEMRNKRIKGKR